MLANRRSPSCTPLAAAILGLVLGASGLAALTAGGAEASEYYSRRRVNGVWETGSFPKQEVDAELKRLGAYRSAKRAPSRPAAKPRAAARPAQPETTSSLAVRSAPADAAHMDRLKRAMEAKAREVLASLSPDRVSASPTDVANVEMELAPTSVVYDYAGRIKITTYPGDIVVREPLLAAAAPTAPARAATEHGVAATPRPAAP